MLRLLDLVLKATLFLEIADNLVNLTFVFIFLRSSLNLWFLHVISAWSDLEKMVFVSDPIFTVSAEIEVLALRTRIPHPLYRCNSTAVALECWLKLAEVDFLL